MGKAIMGVIILGMVIMGRVIMEFNLIYSEISAPNSVMSMFYVCVNILKSRSPSSPVLFLQYCDLSSSWAGVVQVTDTLPNFPH